MKDVKNLYCWDYTARGGYKATITSPHESHLHHVSRQLKAYDDLVDACKRALPLLEAFAKPNSPEKTASLMIKMALNQAGELKGVAHDQLQ